MIPSLAQSTFALAVLLAAMLISMTGCDRGDGGSGVQAGGDQTAGAEPATQEGSDFDRASAAFARGDFPSAERWITKHLVAVPDDAAALELAGDIAAAQRDAETAAELYLAAIGNADNVTAVLYEKRARQLMNLGDPYAAAETLEELIRAYPNLAKTRADYAGLAASLGMVEKSAEHLRWLLRRGRGGLNELIMLANLRIPQTDEAICEYALEHNPSDKRVLYPLAVVDVFESKWEQAAERLAEVTKAHPEFAPASALHARVLVHQGDESGLASWESGRAPGCQRWTAYWMAAGYWAERKERPDQAVAAFWEAVKLDNANGEALVHLSANLSRLGDREAAAKVAEVAANVNAMHDSIESLFSWRKNSQEAALEVARAMNRLGRVWEAEAWARSALAMTQQTVPEAREVHAQFRAALTSTTPWQLADATLDDVIDETRILKYEWKLAEKDSMRRETLGAQDPSTKRQFRFHDEARKRGLEHWCGVRDKPEEKSLEIFHSNGGGVAVIDVELDGWPDLYLTSTDGTPMQVDSSPNRLYRNLQGSFREVTEQSSTGDRGFTQGVAVGDYNEDGFADLLVANIGRNRLYRNNGDGTFSDVTDQVGLSGEHWTSSVAIADLDSDAMADIFEVQYCAGDQVYSQLCIDNDVGQARSCSPLVFPAASDRTWKSTRQGTFQEVSGQWLLGQKAGHGLGLVIGRFDDIEGQDVYVANDMTANQYWSGKNSEQGFQFSEQAAIRGLAVNARSQSQASMGIAVGDADSDGDLDLFLTHFTDDYNTFYEQVAPGTWFDRTSTVGLDTPSSDTLAFGTEWIDADNDGQLELLVANGNVDDFSHQGHPLRMVPQLFQRSPEGRWLLASPESLGEYFRSRVVGRALATVDVNRDGRTDSVITHLFDPVAVLINQTETSAGMIRLWLRGRDSSRDAIGATVRFTVDGKERFGQLTAGDGYQCSNQRCLSFGLGALQEASNVTVQWPSGNRQSLGTLRAGSEYVVVEGETEPYRLATLRAP